MFRGHEPDFILSSSSLKTGTARAKVKSRRNLSGSLVPLPPLAEQHRIVARVDELMALCDRLEAAQAKRETAGTDYVPASSAAPDDNRRGRRGVAQHARFYLSHLPALTTRPDQIKQLRQTILNLAVRGRLVPQDPSDEPASELLKRIGTWKAQPARLGRSKGDTKITPVYADDAPFPLPSTWIWAPLGAVHNLARRRAHSSLKRRTKRSREGLRLLWSIGRHRQD